MLKENCIQKFLHRIRFEDLSTNYLRQLVEMAREEDLSGAGLANTPLKSGDLTSSLMARTGDGQAILKAREPLIVCGLPLLPIVLESYHTSLFFEASSKDGALVPAGGLLGTVNGPISELLMAERVLLNFLQFLSGVATETRKYRDALGDSETRLLDTRKTTPGYRMLQKYAVACGGGWNHRLGLFDRIMLKDNHLAASKAHSGQALTQLIVKARSNNPDVLIEVEVDALAQIPSVLEAQPDKIMLDNFSVPDTRQAIELIDNQVCTEATGGITLETLPELGKLGLDFISTGALIHKAKWNDIGLDWKQ